MRFPKWFSKLGERELEEEFAAHFALHVDENLRAGMTREEALRQARIKFGGVEAAKEDCRDVLGARFAEQTWQDLRYAVRLWRRSPGFAFLAIAILGAGIGGSVAVFSVIDPLLFRSLPYPNDSELVSFGYLGPIDTNEFTVVSSYLDWRKTPGPLAAMTSMRPGGQCDLVAGDSARQVPCVAVEANFLRLFGAIPAVGRDFNDEEDVPGAVPVGLISFRLWHSAFGGDPRIINRTVTVDADPVRIIGVLPPSFEMPQLGDADILRPARLNASLPRGANSSALLRAFGRLRPGISVEQGRLRMEPLMRAAAPLDVPKELQSEIRYAFRSLRDRRIHEVKAASWMLMGAVAALLLISCANVASLLMARSASRARELALRSAVGAGRWRLIRQSLAESSVLGLSGCAAGCVAGWLLLRLVFTFAPSGMLRLDRATLNWRILLFAVFSAALSTIAFGLAPAFQRPSPKARARKLLTAVQVALAAILLTGASLFLRSLAKIENNPMGFEPERVVMASFTLRQQRYASAGAQASFLRELEERLGRIAQPGYFALADSIPPSGAVMGRPYSNIRVVGRAPLEASGGMVVFRRVTPGYFRTLQIPLIAGRGFTEMDRTESEDPVILGASLASSIFPHESPVGHRLHLDGDAGTSLIVGIAADVRNNGITEALSPEYYRLRMADGRQVGRTTLALFRVSVPTDRLAALIRRELAELDPALPVEVRTLVEHVRGFQERPRFLAFVVTSFALLGLLLAAGGLYGVLAFLVTQRTKEIGIRVAIGARPKAIAWMIQREALGWTLGGLAAGIAGSLLLSTALRSLLFEVSPYDVASIAAAAGVLLTASVVATWLPSRMAAGVDPAVALRAE